MANDKTSEAQQPTQSSTRYFSKPKSCQFCADKTLTIDYKKVDLLKKYISEEGTIRPRRQTGTCAKHQRAIATAIKQARHIALLPFTSKHAEKME